MAQNITLLGASYSGVPSVLLPKTGGGTASFTDVTDTTAAASDVASGKYFYTSAGVRTEGTSTGGSVFLVTVGYNDSTGKWEPDCTWAQVKAADAAGKTITVQANPNNNFQMSVDGNYDSEGDLLFYFVRAKNSGAVFEWIYTLTSNGLTAYEDGEEFIQPTGTIQITENGNHDVTGYATASVNVSSGGGVTVKTKTGTFTGNGTRTIDISSVTFDPDIVYFNSDPGTTASSGTVAAIIVRGYMTATRYRNNSTTNSHYAIPGITGLNTGGSSYSWRATYDSTNSKLTLYCFSNNARALLTNGRTYSYTLVKYTT